MTFDNSKTIINIRIKLFGVTVIFLAFIILTYIAKMITYPLLGLGETTWTLIFAGLYLIYLFYPLYLNYQYIYYSDDDEKIVFRYFTAGMTGGRKNSIEIRKREISGYKIEKRFFGAIIGITLYQKLREGVAKYPTVYISSLSVEERSRLIRSLNQYIPNQ